MEVVEHYSTSIVFLFLPRDRLLSCGAIRTARRPKGRRTSVKSEADTLILFSLPIGWNSLASLRGRPMKGDFQCPQATSTSSWRPDQSFACE